MPPRDDTTDLLEADLRALKPAPRPEFVRELDARVAARFPRQRRERRRLAFVWRPQFAAAAGALAAAVIAIVLVSGGGGGAKAPSFTAGGSAASGSAAEKAPSIGASKHGAATDELGAPSVGGAAGSTATRAPAPHSTAATPQVAPLPAPGARRRVERTTDLTVSVPRGRMQDTAQRVFGIVTAAGGVVQSSNVASGEGAGASFDLRVPASRVTRTVAELARLGHVRSETNSTLDVTRSYTSLSGRLADAEAERRGLLRQLAKAVTQNETDSLKARLRLVEGRINGLQSSLAALRTRTDYARVSLELVPRNGAIVVPPKHGSTLTPGRAWHDAGRVLAAAAAIGLIGLAVALPVAIVALLGWLGYRPVVRRRREHALDLA